MIPADEDFLDALAEALAVRLTGALSLDRGAATAVDSSVLAARLGVSAQWVRDHADELGGWRLGNGPKAPYRFNAARAERALRDRIAATSEPSGVSDRPEGGLQDDDHVQAIS